MQLSFGQLQALWIRAGGPKDKAPIAAAVALAESGGRSDALNATPPDYSVGPWQINYYGPLADSRTQRFGPANYLRANPLANARAAVAISNGGQDFSAWTTYTNGAWKGQLEQHLGELPQSVGVIPFSGGLSGGKSLVGGLAATGETGQGPFGFVGKLESAVNPLDFLKALADPNLWLRIGQVVAGAVLAFAGIVLLVKQVGLAAPSAPGIVGKTAEAT